MSDQPQALYDAIRDGKAKRAGTRAMAPFVIEGRKGLIPYSVYSFLANQKLVYYDLEAGRYAVRTP